MSHVETFLQKGFGSLDRPLLMSLRASSVSSQEVIGLGLTDEIAERMALKENANCVWDSYRRLLASYAQVHLMSPMFNSFWKCLRNGTANLEQVSTYSDIYDT